MPFPTSTNGNLKSKTLLTGLLVGLILPAAALLLFFAWKGEDTQLLDFFICQQQNRLLSPLLSLAVLPNLGIFWIFIKRNQYMQARGVIFATLLLAVCVILLKFSA